MWGVGGKRTQQMQETMEVSLLVSRVQRVWAGESRSEHSLDLKLEGAGTESELCHSLGLPLSSVKWI